MNKKIKVRTYYYLGIAFGIAYYSKEFTIILPFVEFNWYK